MAAMNAYSRRQVIVAQLQSQRYVEVNALAETFGVTMVTIRNDLAYLEQRGLVVRTHGGAVPPEDDSVVREFGTTIKENRTQKEAIALAAASLVEDGDTVIIDSGSTGAILAKIIKKLKLTVVTNSLPVIQELKECEHIELVVIGGVLRRHSYSLIGDLTSGVLGSINADWYFMGSTVFDIIKGVSSSNIMEGQTKQMMLKAANHVCLLADSSKCGKTSLFSVCGWNQIDIFVTDALSETDRAILREQHEVDVRITSAG